jgi:HEPN domain-containing protein
MCDIRYFKLARHNFDVAKHLLMEMKNDEMYLRDITYNLQQSVEKTLKAFLEFKGVTVPPTHKLRKLIQMSRDNGSAAIITKWICENALLLENWEAESRYDLDFFVELGKCQEAVDEIENFLALNGLCYEKDASLDVESEEKVRDIVPVDIKDDFELNIYYHIFRQRIGELENE